MKKSKGFTLIELIIVVFIITFLALITFGIYSAFYGDYKWPSEREKDGEYAMKVFVHQQGYELVSKLECQADSDEYEETDCEAKVRKPNGKVEWFYANCDHETQICVPDPRFLGIFGD